MGSNPVNLALRFALEITAFTAMGYWGWTQHSGLARFLWALGLPLIFAILWGTFAVPGDPSRSGKAPVPVPGALRLLLEFSFFGIGAWAIYDSINWGVALIFGSLVIIHYALSYDRIAWLLKPKH